MILDEYKSTFQPHTNKNLQKQKEKEKEKDNDNDNATMNSYSATTFWNCWLFYPLHKKVMQIAGFFHLSSFTSSSLYLS